MQVARCGDFNNRRCSALLAAEIACARGQPEIEIDAIPIQDAVSMALTQAEADSLLRMPKEFVDPGPLEFTQTQPMNYDRLLHSEDRREQFVLTVKRGRRKRIRLKYQTRLERLSCWPGSSSTGPRTTTHLSHPIGRTSGLTVLTCICIGRVLRTGLPMNLRTYRSSSFMT